MKSLLSKSALLATVATLAIASQGYALTISLTDTRYLGFFDPGTPASAAGEATQITNLIGLLPAGEPVPVLDDVDGVIDGNDYGRTGVPTAGLPDATATGADSNNSPLGSVDVTGFTYLLAKYGTAAHVWYIGGLSGFQDVPLNEPGGAFGTNGQSHYSLYNPSSTSVPEGGLTVALLGAAMAALAFARRQFR